MAQSSDKPRASVRETSRLRATLSSEPSGGYAFHDERRIAQQRPAAPKPAQGENGDGLTGVANDSWTERPFDLTASLKGASADHGSLSDADEVLFGDERLLEARSEVYAPALAAAEQAASAEPASLPTETVPTEGIWTALPSVVDEVEHDRPSPRLPDREDRDPVLLQAEQLVEKGAWDDLVQLLTPKTALSPALELLLLIGRRETETGDDREQASALSQAIISAVGRALSLPTGSPVALIIGKRLMRRNPVWTRQQPARGLSVGIVLLGLGLGTAIGWLITKLTL